MQQTDRQRQREREILGAIFVAPLDCSSLFWIYTQTLYLQVTFFPLENETAVRNRMLLYQTHAKCTLISFFIPTHSFQSVQISVALASRILSLLLLLLLFAAVVTVVTDVEGKKGNKISNTSASEMMGAEER